MRLFAYLDPGSGSIILQTLLGGAAAALVSIKMFGRKVYRSLMFWKKFDDEDEPGKGTSTTAATQHDAERAAQHETEKEPV
jgi:hypothetical protein